MTYNYDRVEMLKYVPQSAVRILEVGCDTGNFGRLLRERRPTARICGIDPVAHPADAYDERITGLYPSDMPTADQFDCIVFNDVLEHMADPWDALRQTQHLLEPRGVVVASIPNVRHRSVLGPLISRGEWEYKDVGVLDRTHLRFFTRSSIEGLFRSTGYDPEVRPINADRPGPIPYVDRALRRIFIDFLALQYAVVATPTQ